MVGSQEKYCVEDISDPQRFRLTLQSASLEQCEDFIAQIRALYAARSYRILRVGRYSEVVAEFGPHTTESAETPLSSLTSSRSSQTPQ